jgi:hypothetical protein
MSGTDESLVCRSYRAGHDVHYLQAKRSWRDPEGRRSGQITAIAGRMVEVTLDEGVIVQLWTHDVGHVERLVADRGERVDYHQRLGLLDFPQPDSIAYVSVSTSADIGPCDQGGGALARPEDGEDKTAFAQRLHDQIIERSHDS